MTANNIQLINKHNKTIVLPVSVKNTPPEKKTCGKISCQSTPRQGEDRSFGYWPAWSSLDTCIYIYIYI